MTTHEEAVALNDERAGDAGKAVLAYASVKEARPLEKLSDCYHAREELLIDLLTDLRHWAREDGHDFADAVRLSEMHFESEVDEESDDAPEGGDDE